MAESTDKKYLLIGKCKWIEGEYAGRLFKELKEKTCHLSLAKDKKIIYVFS